MSYRFPTRGERFFQFFNASFLLIISALFLLPFLTVFMSSFVSEKEYITRGPFILLPKKIDFGAYKLLLFQGTAVLKSYRITLFRTVAGTLMQVGATSFLAYGLSKRNLPGRKAVVAVLLFCIVFPVQIVPLFLLNKTLGIIDSLWALLLPRLINTQYVFIMMAFFRQIPESLEESARLDGCSAYQTLFRIVLPLSLASLMTISMFYAVWQWNDWFDAAMFIVRNTQLLPVQNLLRDIVLSSTMSEVITPGQSPPPGIAIKGAVIVISTLPILLAYPYIQKYFVKGMMIGSVKG